MADQLTVSDFREDLEFVFKAVFEVHPRPDHRVSQSDLRAMMELCRSRVSECGSVEDFWLVTQDFFTLMGDGHTYLNVPISAGARHAPIGTTLVEGQVVVSGVSPQEDCPNIVRGDVIVGVGGADVEDRLLRVARYRTHNTNRYARMQAATDLLLFIGEGVDETTLTIVKADNSIREVVVPLYRLDSRTLSESEVKKRRADQLTKCVTAEYSPDTAIGYLAFRKCTDRTITSQSELEFLGLSQEDVPDMEETCWSFFQRLYTEEDSNLILDLRGNTGGNSKIGNILLKYLTDKELSTYAGETKVSQYTRKWFPDKEPGMLLRGGHGTLSYPYESRLDEQRLRDVRPFGGRLFVLIDTWVFSSGEWLAAELAANGLGVFVGQPTGGGGAVPGEQLSISLPKSGLQLLVSCKYFIPPGGEAIQKRGVNPDFWVDCSLEDFRKGRDTILEFAQHLALNV